MSYDNVVNSSQDIQAEIERHIQELDSDVANGHESIILQQVENGVAVRMAGRTEQHNLVL